MKPESKAFLGRAAHSEWRANKERVAEISFLVNTDYDDLNEHQRKLFEDIGIRVYFDACKPMMVNLREKLIEQKKTCVKIAQTMSDVIQEKMSIAQASGRTDLMHPHLSVTAGLMETIVKNIDDVPELPKVPELEE